MSSQAAFSYDGSRPHVTIKIWGRDNQPHNVKILADSISDTTTLYWKRDGKLNFGTIEELFLQYKDAEDKSVFKVLSVRRNPKVKLPPTKKGVICANNAEPSFEDIKDVVYHGIRPVWKVTLRNGKTVEITKDHSVFCAKAYQKAFEAKTLDDLDVVVSVDNYNTDSESKVELSDNFITFLGLWMADGSYRYIPKVGDPKNLTSVSISTGNESKIVEWLQNFATGYKRQRPDENVSVEVQNGNQTFKMNTSVSKTTKCFGIYPNGDSHLNSVILARQVHSYFGHVDSFTKRVPKFLFTASNKQIAAFLKGYFSGDGSIHICNDNPKNETYKYGRYYAVDCSSVSRPLLEDISILLDRLGIKHNITSPQKQQFKGCRPGIGYKLIIHAAPSVETFVNTIGFIKDFKYEKRETYTRDQKLRPVSLRQVRKIEYVGEKPVYDISVDETQAFVANGILCHNSGNDITLLTYKDAAQLGFSREDASGHFRVKGVSENPLIFYTIKTQAQIGDTNPIPIEVGVQFQGDGEMLRESLLGRKSIFENFDVLFSKNKVQFIQNGATVGGINTLGMHLPVQLTSTRVQNSSDIKDLYLNP